jgi:antitoxin HigA-1
MMSEGEKIGAIHPGEVLREDFLLPMGLTAYRLAKELGMTESAVGEILHGKRGITAATALRLSRYFGTSAELWLNLQAAYELDAERARLGDRLDAIEPADLRKLNEERQRVLEERRRPLHAQLAEERERLAKELEAIRQHEPAAA